MSKSVAIIITTRDRASSLRETLASIGRCVVPPDIAAELLVVDNGSTDGTAQVIREAGITNLPVRYVLEKTPGQTRARNAGLRATRAADMVLFTDDDVRVPLDWLEGMCRPIFCGDADAVAGGVHFPAHYEPLLTGEPFRSKRGWLASSEGVDPTNPTGPVGANMAFSRQLIDAVGEFDLELGPGALGFYDDNLFTWRAVKAGFRLRAALGTSVEHHFDLTRLTRKGWLDMAARMGRSEAFINYHWVGDAPDVDPAKLWRARLLLLAERLASPWNALAGKASLREMQRVQTLAYREQLAGVAVTPRKYARQGGSPGGADKSAPQQPQRSQERED